MFRSAAEGETGHAFGHLEFMEAIGDPATGEPIGPTADNLRSAVAGETHEYTDMYPGMAKTARAEGFEEIVSWAALMLLSLFTRGQAFWFETLAKAEKSHAGKFAKTLAELKQ